MIYNSHTHTHTVLMITAGYMGAVSVVTTVKWFWFLFGMAMFLPVTSLNPRA